MAKLGKYERRYMDQLAMLAPPTKLLVTIYSKRIGPPGAALEPTICALADRLSQPLTPQEMRELSREFIVRFIVNAAATIDQKNVASARAFVFSNVCNRTILHALS